MDTKEDASKIKNDEDNDLKVKKKLSFCHKLKFF